MPGPAIRRVGVGALAAAVLVIAPLTTTVSAQGSPTPPGPVTAPATPAPATSVGAAAQLDALYVVAHPDDEAGTLSSIGRWKQTANVRTGVVTITRGEGGGNATGPQEGPALGLLREAEERRAVAKAGVSDVYNLDKVDFYYTVSAPLTQQAWGHEDTLARIVRLIRQTRPKVLLTMNPAPSPGQHGNHQEAALLAVEAYRAAGDPTRFPEQISKEKLRPFAPSRILFRSSWGTQATGPGCAKAFVADDPTQTTYGVWAGTTAPNGRTWAAVEREAQRLYATQGWAGFPDAPTDPAKIGCVMFTQAASRAPYPAPGSAAALSEWGALDGVLTRSPGGLPLGTGLEATSGAYRVQPGAPFTVTVTATAPPTRSLHRVALTPKVPAGWTVRPRAGVAMVRDLAPGRSRSVRFTVTPPRTAAIGARARVAFTASAAQGNGYTDVPVLVSAPVTAHQAYLPQVRDFVAWAAEQGLPQFAGIVRPVVTIPVGSSRQVRYVLENHTATPQRTTLSVRAPAGFTVATAAAAVTVPANGSATTSATVTSTDRAAATSMAGGTAGDHLYDVVATPAAGPAGVEQNAFELVPSTAIAKAPVPPVVNGAIGADEYPGAALDLSRRWEGDACTSAADCSATGHLTWNGDTLFVAVQVKDDTAGTALAADDCKRHWRTDAVEIAIDPRGNSENTSTTFKAAVLPRTAGGGGACFLRDADNHQGPGASTAAGMRVSATNTPTGYTVEAAIPTAVLPGAIDPDNLGLNLFVYDSDTQDRTGQTRIGWSVWGGVQGDPYRWGRASVPGYTPPTGRSTVAPKPTLPLEALSSLDSPQSVEQAVRTNVQLAGLPLAARGGWARSGTVRATTARVWVRALTAGTAHVTIRDAAGTAGSRVVAVLPGRSRVDIPLTRRPATTATAVMGWQDPTAATLSSQVTLR